MTRPTPLGAELYNAHYFRHTLPGIEHLDNEALIDSAAPDTARVGEFRQNHRILDFGSGRGSLAVALAKMGCTVVGIDYSPHAIEYSCHFVQRFPLDIQERIQYRQMRAEDLNFENEFDGIVLNQVYEHLHDWELEILFAKFKRALKPSGSIVISTPNLNYNRVLFPLKRVLELPFKIIKELLRVVRGKSKHATSLTKFLKEIFKIRYPKSEHDRLHINLQTPGSIKRFLTRQGFEADVTCIDRHQNLIGRVMRRWWGETIWVRCSIACHPEPTYQPEGEGSKI